MLTKRAAPPCLRWMSQKGFCGSKKRPDPIRHDEMVWLVQAGHFLSEARHCHQAFDARAPSDSNAA